MKVIINRTGDKMSIMHLIGEADVDAELEKWKQTANGEYVSHFVIPEGVIPDDATPEQIRTIVEAYIA